MLQGEKYCHLFEHNGAGKYFSSSIIMYDCMGCMTVMSLMLHLKKNSPVKEVIVFINFILTSNKKKLAR